MTPPSLEELRERIRRKESEIFAAGEELNDLRSLAVRLERESNERHFISPRPGDFWHDCLSPVLIVLEVADGHVVICDETEPVYETIDEAMVLRSYEDPCDPDVKEYFSRPRKEIGYTFDLRRARRVSRFEFDGLLKCYSGSMKDRLTYRCMPGRADKFVEMWRSGVDDFATLD